MDARTFQAHFASAAKRVWVIAAGICMDGHVADDVLQEVAVVAWQKRAEFRPGTSFDAWVSQIARNLALRHRRDRKSSPSIDAIPEPLEPDPNQASPSPDELLASSPEFLERLGLSGPVARALLSLDATARACLLLRSVLDIDYSEIATLLSIPEGTAMSHVHRSRRRLLEQLPSREAALG